MTPQLDNKIISSFLLYLDHVIQSSGSGYFNTSTLFYQVPSNLSGLYAYASPYKSLSNDVSINNINVLSGVYLNGNYTLIGQSGYQAINHYQGTIYFTGQLPANTIISGNYSVKEFSIQLADQQIDWKMLFETKYVSNNSLPNFISGLGLDVKISPIILVRPKIQESLPFALVGVDNSKIGLRAIVVADNQYQKISVINVLKNLHHRFMPIITAIPFSAVGTITGAVTYNYNTLPIDSTYQPLILGIRTYDVPQDGQYENINKSMAIVDFDISLLLRH